MKKISLVAASILLSTNLVANSFEEAIKSGTISGDVTIHGEKQNNSGLNNDSGFTMGSVGLSYETGELNGFKVAVGFRGNHDFSEVEDDDFISDVSNHTDALLHTANISYTNSYFGLSVGRQEIDLEWLGDFHESAVLGISAIPDTTIIVGYTQKIAVADSDAALDNFADFGVTNDGKEIDYAAVLDLKYEGIEGLLVNPYYYEADNLASWYGLKIDYDTDVFGLTIHGAKSNEDVSNVEDGDIAHFEGRLNVLGLGINAGYISTDNNGGTGSMTTLGDNISPFEDGNQVYEADAKTSYVGLSYEISGVELGALYGQTKYESNKEKELNLTLGYGVTDSLSIGALYVDVDAQNSDDDYNRVALTIEYSF